MSQRFGKAELVYGKDAFKHYKFFMAVNSFQFNFTDICKITIDFQKFSNTSRLPKKIQTNRADPDQTASEEAV